MLTAYLDDMRIISGKAKGRKLYAPKGQATRPTADRVKESVFGMLTYPWEKTSVLDLFAGTGSLGLEALSRGARNVVFVENSRSALTVLRRNISLCGFDSSVTILAMPAMRALSRLEEQGELFQIIFADPPYRQGWVIKTLRAILAHRSLIRDGVLVIEHAPDECTPEAMENLIRFVQRTHGDTATSFFHFEWSKEGRKIGPTGPSTITSKDETVG